MHWLWSMWYAIESLPVHDTGSVDKTTSLFLSRAVIESSVKLYFGLESAIFLWLLQSQLIVLQYSGLYHTLQESVLPPEMVDKNSDSVLK